MKQNFKELKDDQVYSNENNEKIDECTNESAYGYQCMQDYYKELHRICLSKDSSEYDINRYEKTEAKIKLVESEIIGLVGMKSYHDILDVLSLQKECLRENIKKLRDSYRDLNEYINKTTGSLK